MYSGQLVDRLAFSCQHAAMKPTTSLITLTVAFLLSSTLTAFAAPKTIRTEKGGKVVLVIDDGMIRTDPAANPVVLFDGPRVWSARDGKPLFFIAGDIVHAYEPEGTVVGYKDGRQLRNQPQGKETLYIDGPYVRLPNRAGGPIFWIDNNEVLDNSELFGALYVLKPEIFAMPAGGPKMQPKDDPAVSPKYDAKPSAAAAGGAAKPFAGGSFTLTEFQKAAGSHTAGAATITQTGDVFVVELKLADNTTLQGVGKVHNQELWVALGAPNTVGLAIYEPSGDNLAGTWFNITGDASKFGSENLSDGKKMVGPHNITSAKAPFTGAAYAGTVTVESLNKPLASHQASAIHWDLSGIQGRRDRLQLQHRACRRQ